MPHTNVRAMDRRQFLAPAAGGFLGSAMLPGLATAQQPLSAVALAKAEGIIPLSDRLSLS